jgi:hypothetical protein
MSHSWKEKLDEKGLKYVELSAKLHKIRPLSNLSSAEAERCIKEQRSVYSAYPELEPKRKVNLDPEFVRLLQRTHPEIEASEEETIAVFEKEEFPLFRADQLEWHQRIFLAFESSQDRRFKIYGALALGIVLFREFFSEAWKRCFGTKTPNHFQVLRASAQTFEWFGSALRGDLKEPPGRVNVEWAGLVNKILEHQKERLTQVELYDAVKAAGADLHDDPENFRRWVHRARQDGLVHPSRTSEEVKTESETD